MTSVQRPEEHDDSTQSMPREDACAAAPQASIGTHVGSNATDQVEEVEATEPASVHADTMRRGIDGSADTEEIVYDDRTDDRPAP